MVLLHILFFMISAVLIISYVLIVKNYNKKEKEFVDYLSNNNDCLFSKKRTRR